MMNTIHGRQKKLTKTYEVLVYEGWGKTYLVEADSPKEAEDLYENGTYESDRVVLNETFVVDVTNA